MKLLVTGASGFIGSFVVEEGLKQGMEVWAGVRGTSSHKYLQDERIHFIELDFGDEGHLTQQMKDFKLANGKWDYIVHTAGVTKCANPQTFFDVNAVGTNNFLKALEHNTLFPERFVYLSSLSVMGAAREERLPKSQRANGWHYAPITDDCKANPNHEYGRSKLEAEANLKSYSTLPWIILRPTGVYGPREHDYFLMAKSIKQHVDFSVGFCAQELSFIYVKDLVTAIFLALKGKPVHRCYFVSDGDIYSSRTFSDLLKKNLGVKFLLRIKAPIWLLRIICAVGDVVSKITSKPSTLNNDKYHIMRQRNWQCDIQPIQQELNYRPQYPLEKGVEETVAWYKKEKWI